MKDATRLLINMITNLYTLPILGFPYYDEKKWEIKHLFEIQFSYICLD